MIKIGITGQAGFIGTHLYNSFSLEPDLFELIPFEDSFFESETKLKDFVVGCDVIVHLAALNRHAEPNVLYRTNIALVQKLIDALENTDSKPYVLISSSLQEKQDNIYGRSKREGRELLNQWSQRNGAPFTGLIIPNVFGPFGVPFYNSVISTFSHQLTTGLEPKIEVDNKLNLIYVGELVKIVRDLVLQFAGSEKAPASVPKLLNVPHQAEYKVTELLSKLCHFKDIYLGQGVFPNLSNRFDLDLFNTFRSYLPGDQFPRAYTRNRDQRGDYVEIARSISTGQSAFSTTKPGITRGNHFHTRKVERFAVIKGRASIKLRRYGKSEVTEYILDGDKPAYVDMPVWYTHNVTNIGDSELLTLFWINEFYDPADPDTYLEEV